MLSKIGNEFKEFAIKGNMIDMAVGIIIGAAFNGIVDVLVKKIFMPPLSLLTEGINFADKKIVLREAIMKGEKIIQEQVAIEYGTLITEMINFFIIAVVVFFVVKLSNKIRTKSEDPSNPEETTPADIQLLDDIKKIMEEQNSILRKDKAA